MGNFVPGRKAVASRPSQSRRFVKSKERLNRCHTREGIRPCKRCYLPTANLGRYCTTCLDVLVPLRMYVPRIDPVVEADNAADTTQQP